MDKTTKIKLLKVLKSLKEAATSDNKPKEGICFHINAYELKVDKSELQNYTHKLFREWPKYSGLVRYPVPGIEDKSNYASFNRFPKWEGEYGKLRMELLDFMISEIDYEVNVPWLTKQKDKIIKLVEDL